MIRRRKAPLTLRRAAERIARLRARMLTPPVTTEVEFAAVRARIELYVCATYGIGDFAAHVPATLYPALDDTDPVTQYRVLVVQEAERFARGGDARTPAGLTALERDLFEIAEARAVDASIAQSQPGLRPALEAARATARTSRVRHQPGTLGNDVEALVQDALGDFAPDVRTVHENATWARDTARALMSTRKQDVRYYSMLPISFWTMPVTTPGLAHGFKLPPRIEVQLKVARKGAAPKDAEPSLESTAAGSASAPERDDLPPSRDAFANPERAQRAKRRTKRPEGVPHHYREWDDHANAYHPDGATVYVTDAPMESPAWADTAEREHAILLRQVRQRFERLQSHRQHLKRQLNGDELDLDACVAAVVDRRAGRTPDDRLYAAVRPGRRSIAIALLVDTSASTKAIVHDTLRIIDVERLAVLVGAEAFEALGDSYGMLAFSSDGAQDVRVRTLKHFEEAGRAALRARVSGIDARGETRMGAALRHATAQLLRRSAPHRLLLMVSDGKPNDSDRYYLDYGVADSRRAVLDARAAGVHPYCITVDPGEPGEYLADIFGKTGYLVVRRPEQLPQALVRSVQMLIPG
ncbi:MAG: VWA domain-containing protein [Gemmatimonadaceae bacterium]